MVVGHSHDVRAALSLEDLPPDVTFETSTTVVDVPDVRCVVRAVLRGPDFEITPSEAREQSFIGTRELVWEWKVRPKRAGDGLELTLVFQAKVVEDDRTEPGPEILNTSVINVDAAPVSPWRRIVDTTSGFFGNPAVQYLLPAGGVGGLWLVLDHLRKKKSPTKPG